MSLVSDLHSFPLACIYVLIDKVTKNFHMGYSHESAILGLARELTNLRKGVSHPVLQSAYSRGELEIEIVKEYKDNELMPIIRAEYNKFVETYKADGYTDLRNYKSSNYRLLTRILTDYRSSKYIRPLVYVLARTRINGEVVMAVFHTKPEADAWIDDSFGAEKIGIVPKFHDNELTKGFHKDFGYKMESPKPSVKQKFKRLKDTSEKSE